MSKTRNLSDLLDANGDVKSTALDNVPASDVVNDTSPQLGGDLASNGNDILMADNDKIKLGTGNDLEIYHDGSNSIIKDAGTGNIHILADDFKVMNSSGTENIIFGAEDGTARLFHNNVTKFETTSSGATVTGTLTADGVSVGDNENIYLGASNDLNIYHDGVSTSYIKASSDLVMQGTDDIVIRDASTQEEHIRCNHNDSVQISYDGSVKLTTTSTGVTVTGTIVGDGAIANRFFGWGKQNSQSNSGWRTIDFNNEEIDDNNSFTHTTGSFVVPHAGTYVFFAGHNHTNGDHSDYEIQINSNSNGTLAKTGSPNTNQITITCMAECSSSEVITCQVYHSNTNHTDAGTRSQFFGGYRID